MHCSESVSATGSGETPWAGTVVDLHSHSTASDGSLQPAALIREAKRLGVEALALTDHDTVAGLEEAGREARHCGIQLIPGIELSVLWENKVIHVVGLNIDPEATRLRIGIRRQQATRGERAMRMARKMEKAGVDRALERAVDSSPGAMITRTHFARLLVEDGLSKNMNAAFKQYLGRGRPCYAGAAWAGLGEAIDWIQTSGGVAVLAHPLRYQLSAAWIRRLLTAFKTAGGAAIEVVCGSHSANETTTCAGYAWRYGLQGSAGSDFHDPGSPWVQLGRLAPMPEGVKPVWAAWSRAVIQER